MPKVAVLLVCAGCVMGQQASAQDLTERDPAIGGSPEITVSPARSNAALQYHHAWILLEPVLEFDGLSDEEREAAEHGELPEAYSAILESEQDNIRLLIEATELDHCDFGIQYEKGIEATMAHLSLMRSSSRLLMADHRRLVDVDTDSAVQRLAAAIRLGEHASRSSFIIGSLVGVAIVESARSATQELIDAGSLSAQQARVINDALDLVLTDDPFHSFDALKLEGEVMVAWLQHEFQGESGGRELSRVFKSAGGTDVASNPSIRELRRKNGEQVAQLADQMNEGYSDILDAWNATDPVAAMNAVEMNAEIGRYGLAAKLLLPAMSSFRTRHIEAVDKLEALREQLSALETE